MMLTACTPVVVRFGLVYNSRDVFSLRRRIACSSGLQRLSISVVINLCMLTKAMRPAKFNPHLSMKNVSLLPMVPSQKLIPLLVRKSACLSGRAKCGRM